jgi:hypothetical protein
LTFLEEKAKSEFMRCFRNYRYNAWGYNTFNPQTGAGRNDWGYIKGSFILLSSETAYLMGLSDIYRLCVDWMISNDIQPTTSDNYILVEGWLFAASYYYKAGKLTGSYTLKGKAVQAMNKALDVCYNPSTRLAYAVFNPITNSVRDTGWGYGPEWSIAGAFFHERGDADRLGKVKEIFRRFNTELTSAGLPYPVHNPATGAVSTSLSSATWHGVTYRDLISPQTMGVMIEGDLHMYVATGDVDYLNWAKKIADAYLAVLEKAAFKAPMYVTADGTPAYVMEGLSHMVPRCYAWLYRETGEEEYLKAAEEMIDVIMSRGIPNMECTSVDLWDGSVLSAGSVPPGAELTQSLLDLYNATLNRKYRLLAEQRLDAALRYARAPYGLVNITNVLASPPTQGNYMADWLMAESLKYLWLFHSQYDPVRDRLYIDTIGGLIGVLG